MANSLKKTVDRMTNHPGMTSANWTFTQKLDKYTCIYDIGIKFEHGLC